MERATLRRPAARDRTPGRAKLSSTRGLPSGPQSWRARRRRRRGAKILDEAAFAEEKVPPGCRTAPGLGCRARAPRTPFASFADDDDPSRTDGEEEEVSVAGRATPPRLSTPRRGGGGRGGARETHARATHPRRSTTTATWRAISSVRTRPSPETYRARDGRGGGQGGPGETRARRRLGPRARGCDDRRARARRRCCGVARGESDALRSEMLRWHPDKFGAIGPGACARVIASEPSSGSTPGRQDGGGTLQGAG